MILSCQNICKAFGEKVILNDASFHIEDREKAALIGCNGAGKTTILNIISMLEQPDAGEIVINENNHFTKKKIQNLRRYVFGYIFQNYVLIEEETVKENLLISKKYRKNFKEQELEEVMYKVGLPKEYLDHKVYELSGGEQQRVAIARTMLKPCEIILADEPTGNLDAHNKEKVIQLFQQMKTEGKTIICVTHDEEMAKKADRIICLQKERG